ncbi:MAG: transposase [Succinivibrio sp.]|nr:transposase [Succinivibrio sp.]
MSERAERPNLEDYPEIPAGAKLQRNKTHWYVFTVKYSRPKGSKHSLQERVYHGQIVDGKYYTNDEYSRFFTRNGVRRAIPLAEPTFDRRRKSCRDKEQERTENTQSTAEAAGTSATSPALVPAEELRAPDFSRMVHFRLGGAALVLSAMKKTGLEEDLLEAGFYKETVAVIASLVAFNLCKGDNSFYLYPIWAQGRLLPWGELLDSKQLSDFFIDIGAKQQDKISRLFALRMKRVGESELMSIDSSNIATEAEDIEIAALGKSKDGGYRKQVCLYVVLGHDSRIPVLYRFFAGNIHDSSTMGDIYKRMSDLNIGSGVTDRGYGSLKNLILAHHYGIKMSFAMKSGSEFVTSAIRECRERLLEMRLEDRITGHGVYGRTCTVELEEEQERFTVWRQVFLDVKKRERAIDKLYNDLTAFEQGWEAGDKTAEDNPLLEKYYLAPEGDVGQCKLIRDMAKIEAKLWDAGFFVNAATYEQTAAENIDGYSQRDCIEKHFRTDKSCLGEDAVRVQSLHALMGRGLIYFVAASIAEHFKKLLRTPIIHRQANGKVRYTAPVGVRHSLREVLTMADTIGVNRYADGTRCITEITQKFQDILDQIGYQDAFDLKALGL